MKCKNVIVAACSFLLVCIALSENASAQSLRRGTVSKPIYTQLGDYLNTDKIVLKIRDDAEAPVLNGTTFLNTSGEWNQLNQILTTTNAAAAIAPSFTASKQTLDAQRKEASQADRQELTDLSRYFDVAVAPALTNAQKLSMIQQLNDLTIVEIAYFPAIPKLAITDEVMTGNWQGSQDYLSAAPAGVDAYYAWENPGGKGQNIKVVDIEGNWVEHHEDLRGGTHTWHIAGGKIADPTWYMHGTAVLGEIASDSNGFGTTGIAYQVNLGTVSIGTMSIGDAINTAVANTAVGDVILLELQIGGPNGGAYVPVEYEQSTFDAILAGTSAGRIIVEAGANGGQNLDDAGFYGNLFNPSFRLSGAMMVGAATHTHVPEGFSSWGTRLDVHGYGQDVYTLGYGDLAGSDTTTYYTAQFSGTSSASPIITGSCAVLQGVQKATYGTVMNHAEMRSLLQTFSTPQVNPSHRIGPMPNLRGAVDNIIGVSFSADTVFGWAPLTVNFTGSSGLPVDTWTWLFGDGDSAFTQNSPHTYTSAGIFDVELGVTSGMTNREKTRSQYIAVVADTLHSNSPSGAPDSLVELVISGNNSVPVNTIKVSFDLSGTLGASLESYTTTGCRTAFMGDPIMTHFIGSDSRFTLRVRTTTGSLPPGNGPIMKVYLRIPPTATSGQTTTVNIAGYTGHNSEYSGIYPLYNPAGVNSTISVCEKRGDLNHSGTINVLDINMMVSYMFNGGPAPSPISLANINCSSGVDVLDLIAFISYVFSAGPPPCGC